ncbi:MAG TPA: dihydrofolate reductase family protein [Rectinemataceae bacterium]|nr:dihydrofolate reductase family protein [Rectinemataceae bacterium]
MRKLVVAEFISLDGVIQAPGGAVEDQDGGFSQGGWTRSYWHDDIGAHFFAAFSKADALLLGRRTWEGHGGAFEPMPPGDPFGDAMNGIRKYVVTRSLKSAAAWRNSVILSGPVVEEVRKLKAAPGKDILLDGSSVLVHELIKEDLVDEYLLHVYPLSLGGGKKLFPEGMRVNLKLLETVNLPTGVVYLHYVPVRGQG